MRNLPPPSCLPVLVALATGLGLSCAGSSPPPRRASPAPVVMAAPARRPPAPPPEPVGRRVLASAQGELGLPGILAFQAGTDQFAPGLDHTATLQALVRYLQANPGITRIRIEGHTDSMGLASRNERLSGARALAVKTWLVNHGIAPQRVVAVGCGETKPLESNRTAVGRARNRRMTLLVTARDGKPFLGRDANGGCVSY